MTTEHPFAQYIRILGRGRHGSRAMTFDEARTAMRMILLGDCEPEQVGAFFMLIRVREETSDELAGFVAAVRETIQAPAGMSAVRIDWSSYAGKRRHLPWFLLAALLLARSGYPVLMHGIAREGDGRVYTPDALARLGMPVCKSLAQAGEEIQRGGFAYVPLEAFAPRVAQIIGLRQLLGLRSPANSVARMLNPLGAPVQLLGIFHPNYRDIHQDAAVRLEQPHMAVLKGRAARSSAIPMCRAWSRRSTRARSMKKSGRRCSAAPGISRTARWKWSGWQRCGAVKRVTITARHRWSEPLRSR